MREVMTPDEVAALLQIHVKTVYRLARQGVLPGRQIGRRWRFSRMEILACVSRQWAGAAAPTLEQPSDGR
jgi:excisionase family DNA binding protein